MPVMLCRKTAKPAWWRREPGLFAALLMTVGAVAHATSYREDFDNPGKPEAPEGYEWSYRAELCPVKTWDDIVPGDGFAYLSVKRDWLKPRKANATVWPFQTLTVGPVRPGHRLVMRAKDTTIPGVASMIFTHRENRTIDEIDIEITADDTYSPETGHPVGPDGGWTDVRLNTYDGADPKTLVPSRRTQRPIIGEDGKKVSHRDGKFHTYAIEWHEDFVRFVIDGVEQAVIDDAVPEGEADLIIGLRQMPWAGQPDWEDYRTMLVDWIAIEPLEKD